MYYFDSFGVETPPLFLEEYVDLGSNERIQQYDESYCGAYCLYMIYLIDRGFRIKSALNILVNQVKCPEIYNECFCLGCNVNDKYNVNDINNNNNDNNNDNDNDNDNVNDNDNDNVNVNVNVNVNDNDNDNDLRSTFANNVNVNDNQGTCFADDKDNDSVKDNFNNSHGTCFADDDFIYQGTCFADLFDEKHQKGKPNNNSPTKNISVNIKEDLQSWLNDDNIITEAAFPDNLRCIISGPSECGKTFLLKKNSF